jgi:hypothetical protein
MAGNRVAGAVTNFLLPVALAGVLVPACSTDNPGSDPEAQSGTAGTGGAAGRGTGGVTGGAGASTGGGVAAGSGGAGSGGKGGSGAGTPAGGAFQAGGAGSGGASDGAGAGGRGGTGGATAGLGAGGGAGTSLGGGGTGGAGDGGDAGAPLGGAAGGGGLGGNPLPDPGSEGDGDFELGPNYTSQPDLSDQGAPKGKSFQFSLRLADSEIFDGKDSTLDPNKPVNTSRNIQVYVPDQYEDGTPAPVLVIQDGPGELGQVQNALDNLTITDDPERRLPPFIAVAVQNGGNDSKGSERGLEYDTLSDRYARFIDLEVLPAVVANASVKAAYPNLRFTTDPNGRGAIGCSSGGAAALTMGWFRPDLFRRLITYSGTFVDQQDDDAPEEEQYPLGAWE